MAPRQVARSLLVRISAAEFGTGRGGESHERFALFAQPGVIAYRAVSRAQDVEPWNRLLQRRGLAGEEPAAPATLGGRGLYATRHAQMADQ